MRITGGRYRGRRVNSFDIPGVRPSKAIVREAVFSILGPEFCHGCSVIDLFSGSGIMAIESLSRGAASFHCVDSDLRSCRLIRDNLAKLGIPASGAVYHLSAAQALASFSSMGLEFDLFFLDPPYARPEIGLESLAQASTLGLVKPDSVAVFEHQRKIDLPLPEGMKVWKERSYGQTRLTFFTPI